MPAEDIVSRVDRVSSRRAQHHSVFRVLHIDVVRRLPGPVQLDRIEQSDRQIWICVDLCEGRGVVLIHRKRAIRCRQERIADFSVCD